MMIHTEFESSEENSSSNLKPFEEMDDLHERVRGKSEHPPVMAFETLCVLWKDADVLLGTISLRLNDCGGDDLMEGVHKVTYASMFYEYWCDITERLTGSALIENAYSARRRARNSIAKAKSAMIEMVKVRSEVNIKSFIRAAKHSRACSLTSLYEEGLGNGSIGIYADVFASSLLHCEFGRDLVLPFCRSFAGSVVQRNEFTRKMLYPKSGTLVGTFKVLRDLNRRRKSQRAAKARYEQIDSSYYESKYGTELNSRTGSGSS